MTPTVVHVYHTPDRHTIISDYPFPLRVDDDANDDGQVGV